MGAPTNRHRHRRFALHQTTEAPRFALPIPLQGPSPSRSPSCDHPPTAAPADSAEPKNPKAPETLAGYCLEAGKEVGAGGLGRVYAAVHQGSGQPVALKLGSSFLKEDGHR